MANPFVLFENIMEDGTLTATYEASGFPVENILDWRMATPFRWKSSDDTNLTYIKVDLGVGNSASPDTLAVGGHNLDTLSVSGLRVAGSDNDADWTSEYVDLTISSDYPHVGTFTPSQAWRYWRVQILSAPWSDYPQIGILTLGRRLDFTEGVMADLDPYGYKMVTERSFSDHGSPIGVNVRHEAKTFNLSYDEPGFLVTDFFDPASGLGYDDDFMPHVKAGKPFWFAWNIDTQADGVYLCWTEEASHPFVGSTNRRAWNGTFYGYRETA